MKGIFIILIFICACSCTYHEGKNERTFKKPSSDLTTTVQRSSLINSSMRNNQQRIEGKWRSKYDSSASIAIQKREIFYYDATASYKYILNHDTIKIFFDGYNYNGVVKQPNKNLLIMCGLQKFESQADTFFRVKE